jgi:hypothetical protein
MDQDIFRRTYREVNERFCAFEKGVLTNNCECSQSERFCIAEREGVHCRSDAAQAQCLAYLEMLRDKARFAMKTAAGQGVVGHGKAMKLQVGGLRGVKLALQPDAEPPAVIDDVYGTLQSAVTRFGSLEELPLEPLIQQVAAYQAKKRSRRRR